MCVTCAKGKQRSYNQSRKDIGANAPIDRVGGVICSDIKCSIKPCDWRGSWYLINFIDYKTNYCRVFLAKTKDKGTKQFEHFFVYFEKRFNCSVHYQRTDNGGEYKVVDLFCKTAGVRRQVSEANNQA
ncbi:Rve domain containing hypothetical protein [Phytophthora palmivora]|uniref:Integrase catalytic domain-containing protein n=1 Tax=Phytophthora palmivora TaxID=4796 RepID=A0A2P4XVD3_9STRA|nr:Rve domain containing hypothetical protein [Phytophthora palmivora]